MYPAIYELITNFLFNGAVETTSYEHLVAVLITSCICLVVVYLPFSIVRWFFRGFAR